MDRDLISVARSAIFTDESIDRMAPGVGDDGGQSHLGHHVGEGDAVQAAISAVPEGEPGHHAHEGVGGHGGVGPGPEASLGRQLLQEAATGLFERGRIGDRPARGEGRLLEIGGQDGDLLVGVKVGLLGIDTDRAAGIPEARQPLLQQGTRNDALAVFGERRRLGPRPRSPEAGLQAFVSQYPHIR